MITYRVVNENEITELIVVITQGSNAQRVMEEAANENSALRFQVTYYDRELGYLVDKIGDTPNTDTTYWLLYVNDGPGEDLYPSPLGISNWIPNEDSTVEWRYERLQN